MSVFCYCCFYCVHACLHAVSVYARAYMYYAFLAYRRICHSADVLNFLINGIDTAFLQCLIHHLALVSGHSGTLEVYGNLQYYHLTNKM